MDPSEAKDLVPPHRRCSFDHSRADKADTIAEREFVVKVDGVEVRGRMCAPHGDAAMKRDIDAMKELGGDTPEVKKLAEDIARRDHHPTPGRPDRIDSWRIKDPRTMDIGLEPPTAPPPERGLGGYDGRTI